MGILLFGLMLCSYMLPKILADFEHTCYSRDYYNGPRMHDRYTRCGNHLTEYLYNKCGGMPYFGIDNRKKRSAKDIFLDTHQAHDFLRVKRAFNTGIVCECCINQCTAAEVEQYCISKRKKRSTSIADILKNGVSTKKFLKKFYKDIFDTPKTSTQDIAISMTEYEKMKILEATKRQNIEEKFAALLVKEQNISGKLAISSTATPPPNSADINGLAHIIANSIKVPNHHRHRT